MKKLLLALVVSLVVLCGVATAYDPFFDWDNPEWLAGCTCTNPTCSHWFKPNPEYYHFELARNAGENAEMYSTSNVRPITSGMRDDAIASRTAADNATSSIADVLLETGWTLSVDHPDLYTDYMESVATKSEAESAHSAGDTAWSDANAHYAAGQWWMGEQRTWYQVGEYKNSSNSAWEARHEFVLQDSDCFYAECGYYTAKNKWDEVAGVRWTIYFTLLSRMED